MKKLLVFTLLCIVFFQGHTQNTDYYDRMEHIFGNIDKTKVSSGFLKEFGIRFNEVEAYNGVISSNNLVDKTQWQSLYSSLYTMRVGNVAASMTAPSTVFNNLKTQQNNSTDVVLASLYYNYQQYKTNAYTNGDVTVSNDQIFDVSGRNPYDTKTVFGVAPLKKQLQGDAFTFKLPSGLIYTNTSLSLSQVQVDFDDGNGYQTVALNTAKSVTYTFGGEKNIKVKFIYSNGPTLYSQSKIWVDYIASGGGQQARFNGNGFLNENGTLWFNNPVTGNAWNGSTATGLVTIELALGHTELTKPLIVVEGFDPENRFNYFSLINSSNPGGLNILVDNSPSLTLNEAIEDKEYDLVFVDFENSTDFIQRNAYMVEEVIRQINQLKVGNEKNVVLGMSMGGLVARYALRDMELHSKIHDTKLYISHDAPQQGANVPLGFQAFARHLYGEEISIPIFFSLIDFDIVSLPNLLPDINTGYSLLQSPAAQQMLIYQLQGTGANIYINNSTLHDSFSTELSNMGYPIQGNIRNIAIANGSECGNPLGFNAYDTLVNVNETIDLAWYSNFVLAFLNLAGWNPLKTISSLLSTNTDIKVQVNVKALPNQESKQIYKGKIFIKKTILFLINVEEPLIDQKTLNSASTMLPLDNANGGIYNIETFIALPSNLNQYVLQNQFNFIPTYSSLDIGGGNEIITSDDLTKIYNPFTPPLAPKNIPFDSFFANPITSEAHIQFTLNNGSWLMTELADTPETRSCSFICANSEVIGSDRFCTGTRTYTAPLGGDSYQWTITGNAATIQSGATSNSVTITKSPFNSGGWVTLSADVNSTKCGNTTLEKRIYVGVPTFDSIEAVNTLETGLTDPIAPIGSCDDFGFKLNIAPSNQEILEVQWEKVTTNYEWNHADDEYVIITPACNEPIEFKVRFRNNCGWSAWKTIEYNITECSSNCSSQSGNITSDDFIIYPVPVDTTLYVKLKNEPIGLLQNGDTLNIKLYNSSAFIVRNINAIATQTAIDVSNLTTGSYTLVLTYNGQTESHQIVIN